MTPHKNIFVHPSAGLMDSAIKEALVRLVLVRFTDCPDVAECKEGDAVISLSGDDEVLKRMGQRGIACFHVTCGVVESKSPADGGRVRFGDSSYLDKLLRCRSIWHKGLPNLSGIRAEAGDEVLACYGERPVWILRKRAGFSADIVSAPLPKLTGDEQPFDYLDGQRYIQLLPLLHFLRKVTTDLAWSPPPLKACLMFDDPNLHWTSYGYLSYRELIKQAKTSGYHVAFATVPFDAWGSNRSAVSLFKENSEHLSLLIHGNDHARDELGRVRTREGHFRLLAQSLHRIERLEKRTGLHVDRVMVPPHEALADAALDAMRVLGFEGASLTPWMLRYWNPKRRSSPFLGLEIAEMMDGWGAVIPRFKLSPSCEGQIVIAAFLGRPIVPFAHHNTAADGLELLSQASRIINSLGDVRWGGAEMMLRSNYLTLRENTKLRIKLYSCHVLFTVPKNITTVVVELPEKGEQPTALVFTITNKAGGESQVVQAMSGVPVEVMPGATVEVVSHCLGKVDYHSIESPQFAPWALPRRMFCEGRDRLMPVMSKLRRG
jgi:hypothetical protein